MIGRHFAQLEVIKQVGTVRHGRNNIRVWLCRCSCGRTLEVDQNSLKKGEVPACKVCRRGACVICGSEITNETYSVKRNTCSDLCQKEQVRRKNLKRYSKLTAQDPAYNKKHHQARKERNPNYEQERYLLRKARLSKLPDAERQAAVNKANKASSEWRTQYINKLKQDDPEAYQNYLARMRQHQRNHQMRKSLAEIAALQETLENKSNE